MQRSAALQRLPEAKLTEGVSIDDYSTWRAVRFADRDEVGSPFPSRFIVSDRSSPSRVRFAASRPGRLRADPKDALFTRGKGGFGPWGARASG